MASERRIAKNRERIRLVAQHRERRDELRARVKDQSIPQEERELAMHQLSKLPRDSSPSRVRNRCLMTGRSRGYYRKFGLSRIALRELALKGDLPGVTKSSW